MISLSPPKFLNFEKAAALINQMIIEGANDNEVREKATELIRYIPQTDHMMELQAIFDYVQNVRYTGDPTDEDLYQTAGVTIKNQMGDCDDKVILAGALARSIGFPVLLCFVFEEEPKMETQFPAHVFLEADVSKSQGNPTWVALETIPVPGGRGHNVLLSLGQFYPYGFIEKIEVKRGF